MTKRLGPKVLITVLLALLATPAALAAGSLQLTPVGRDPFPQRGYVVDLPRDAAVGNGSVQVRENGALVRDLSVSPLTASSLKVGVVLAIDASDSMAGRPSQAALAAARIFVHHRAQNEQIGLLAFNSQIHLLEQPTLSGARLSGALSRPPALAYGTHIFDALDRALAVLKRAELSTGAIVLLSDGADVGSTQNLEAVVAQAQAQHVRIFTVGLRSPAFDPALLRSLAQRSGGSYSEAASSAELKPIYAALAQRLASEYLIQYRSAARPTSHVAVSITVNGYGSAGLGYTAPTPSGLAPFHRSFASRFLLSPVAIVAFSILVAALVAFTLQSLLGRKQSAVVERVNQFVLGRKPAPRSERKRRTVPTRFSRSQAARGRFAMLERDLAIAEIGMSAKRLVSLTAAATAAVFFLLALISPIVALLAFLVPLVPRAYVKRRLDQLREEFSEQLPTNLAVLASALRAGHGFAGALSVVVENAHQPSQNELGRVLSDDQLGVPIEAAVRRVAVRMASRDLEQIALVAELQRTAGGNAAEVLDTVVDTIRERGDIRRLVRTLSAQGRMARWILTCLPIFVGGFFWLIQPGVMRPMFTSSGGQLALVVAALMVVAGSLSIKRIVDIKV
jgi:tight adherence protein B